MFGSVVERRHVQQRELWPVRPSVHRDDAETVIKNLLQDWKEWFYRSPYGIGNFSCQVWFCATWQVRDEVLTSSMTSENLRSVIMSIPVCTYARAPEASFIPILCFDGQNRWWSTHFFAGRNQRFVHVHYSSINTLYDSCQKRQSFRILFNAWSFLLTSSSKLN